jgi:hypothetical protein
MKKPAKKLAQNRQTSIEFNPCLKSLNAKASIGLLPKIVCELNILIAQRRRPLCNQPSIKWRLFKAGNLPNSCDHFGNNL